MVKSLSRSTSFAYVAPVALVALSACKKGEGLTNAVNGAVVKGPLSNALVFLDLNDNNTLDPGEQSIRTEADGSFSITTMANDYKIVAITDASTVDTSSGAVLSGVTLSAPKEAGVITPTTTLMEEGGLSADDVAAVLGLPDGVDPLTFNPYAAGVDAADALAVEKISQQIITAVSSFASAAEGAGASEAGAFEAALQSVVDVVVDKADGAATLDFTAAADLDLIKTNVAAEAANLAGIDVTTMNAMIDDTATSIENVNSQIETATDLTSDASKGIFSSLTVLKDQVKAAAEAELATPGSGAASMTFTDPDAVAASAANAQPSDIELSNLSVNEAADSLVVGSATTDDPDQETGHAYELLEIEGQDHAAFAINASTGELSLLAQPDTEAKSSYVVSVQSTDDGGKYTAGTFDIEIKEDPQEALVTLTVTYESGSVGAGQEYLEALGSLETDFSSFVSELDALVESVDNALISNEFGAPVSTSDGYTLTFGSYEFEIVGGTLPTELSDSISGSSPSAADELDGLAAAAELAASDAAAAAAAAEAAEDDVDTAQMDVDDAQMDVDMAQMDVDDAQMEYEMAMMDYDMMMFDPDMMMFDPMMDMMFMDQMMFAEDDLMFAEDYLMFAEDDLAAAMDYLLNAEEAAAEAQTLAQTLADASDEAYAAYQEALAYEPTFSLDPISSSSSTDDHAYEDSWSFDQGVTGLIVSESDVEKFRVEINTDGNELDLTLGSATSGSVKQVSYYGDFSEFSFEDFDILIDGLAMPDDYDDYDDYDDENSDEDDFEPLTIEKVEIFRDPSSSTADAEMELSSSSSSSYLDTISLSVGDFTLEIVEEIDEDLEIMSAGEIFELAQIDLLDVDEILMDGVAATATFGHSSYGPLIVLDSSALASASSIPQMSEDFEIGTVENLTGAEASALDGAKYATDANDAATIYFDFGSRNGLITDEEFASYWDAAEDLEEIFTDISDIA